MCFIPDSSLTKHFVGSLDHKGFCFRTNPPYTRVVELKYAVYFPHAYTKHGTYQAWDSLHRLLLLFPYNSRSFARVHFTLVEIVPVSATQNHICMKHSDHPGITQLRFNLIIDCGFG